MNGSLAGLRVALLEARRAGELASFVRRAGGEPVCAPAMREEERDDSPEVDAAIDWLLSASEPVVVLTTGTGVDALFRRADARGVEGALRSALAGATTVCRGAKPIAALKTRGLSATVRADAPYTTRELIGALDTLDLRGRDVLVLHWGERATALVDALVARGARPREAMAYVWRLPEDLAPLRDLVRALCAGEIGAIAFTSQGQLRNLLQVAEREGRKDALAHALRTRVIVAAIGPTCADALRDAGVPPQVVPESPKMGPLVAALAQYVSGRAHA